MVIEFGQQEQLLEWNSLASSFPYLFLFFLISRCSREHFFKVNVKAHLAFLLNLVLEWKKIFSFLLNVPQIFTTCLKYITYHLLHDISTDAYSVIAYFC